MGETLRRLLHACAADGDEVQDALMDITGSRTVPQVFVGSHYIGGCDGENVPSFAAQYRAYQTTQSLSWVSGVAKEHASLSAVNLFIHSSHSQTPL